MKREEQIQVYKDIDEKLMQISGTKGSDYGSEDVLSNFKEVSTAAKALGIDIGTPTGYALLLVLLKIARINNLINSDKVPNNESIDDSFLDGINYFKLAFCTYKDRP